MLALPTTNNLGRLLVAYRAGRVGMRGAGAALRAGADAGRAWDTDGLIGRTIPDGFYRHEYTPAATFSNISVW